MTSLRSYPNTCCWNHLAVVFLLVLCCFISHSFANIFPQPRIIGGEDATLGDYPFFVSVLGSDGVHDCGGVLVAKNVVLTAAHCRNSLTRVMVGKYFNNLNQDDGSERFLIEKQYSHPQYFGPTHPRHNIGPLAEPKDLDLEYDLMLLTIRGQSTKQIVRLNFDDALPTTNTILTAIGMGAENPYNEFSSSSILQQVNVNYIPNAECGRLSNEESSYVGFIKDGMLCASAPGKDSCSGDSGGPLLVKQALNEDVDEETVVGLVSWGLKCADDTFPGVYVRLSHHKDWLIDMICQLADEPPSQYYDCPNYAPNDGIVPIEFHLQLDANPEEISWSLTCNDLIYGQGVRGTYGNKPNRQMAYTIYVPAESTCTFTIKDDVGGDGLCCDEPGAYQVYYKGNIVAQGQGNFGAEATHSFSVGTEEIGPGSIQLKDDEMALTVAINLDEHPHESSWQLERLGFNSRIIYKVSQGYYSYMDAAKQLAIRTIAVKKNEQYQIKFFDSGHDGISGGYVQVLLGTDKVPEKYWTSDVDLPDHTKIVVGKNGEYFESDFFATFYAVEDFDDDAEYDPENTVDGGVLFLTLELRLDVFPEDVEFQLRMRTVNGNDRPMARNATSATGETILNGYSDYVNEDEGEIILFRPEGYYKKFSQQTVYETIPLPVQMAGKREFVFIITKKHGLCCFWLRENYVQGYTIYEGLPLYENILVTSKMQEISRESKFFTLQSEEDPDSVGEKAEFMDILVSVDKVNDKELSEFVIQDVETGNVMASVPCTRNRFSAFSLPASGAYNLTMKVCPGGTGNPSFKRYHVKIPAMDGPPLIYGDSMDSRWSFDGTKTFVLPSRKKQVPLKIEFTTSSTPQTFRIFVKRLDIEQSDGFVMASYKGYYGANQNIVEKLWVQEDGLYRIEFENVRESSLVGAQAQVTVGQHVYAVDFVAGVEDVQLIVSGTGPLPKFESNNSLTLTVLFDKYPEEFEYIVWSDDEDGDHQLIWYGPENKQLVLPEYGYVETIPLPTFTGRKWFTLLLMDAGNDGLCCLHGRGGPVELYKGPSEDRNLLMRQDFVDIGRFAFKFYLDGKKEGEKSSSSANPFGLMIWSLTFLAAVICMF